MPEWMPPWEIVLGTASLLLGAVGGWLKGRGDQRKLLKESDLLAQQIYRDALAQAKANYDTANERADATDERLAAAEDRLAVQELAVSDMQGRLESAESIALGMHAWVRDGAPPPPPREPRWITERLDAIRKG